MLLSPCLLVSSYPAPLFSLHLVLVYVIVSTWSSCALLLYIVPLSLLSLLVRCVSSLCYQALVAAPKTRLSDWTGFTTTRSIKLWLLKLLPDLQWSHWLVLLYLLCSPAKLCPGLTLTILLFSSKLPFPTVWTLTSALLISVLSINVTPLIILHLGLSLVNWCDKTLTERTSHHQTQQNES